MHTDKPAQWFRMYAEFATDPKVQMLSEIDQRRYLMLCCLRCGNGDVTLHETEIAFQLRISEQEWAKTKVTLVTKNLVTERGWPVTWEKRQQTSDSSAARVARYREKKKQERNGDVTLQKRSGNVLEIEKEKEKENTKPPVCPPAKIRKGTKITFSTWIAEVKASGNKPISDYAPVWAYAEKVGIPREWIHIAWLKFIERYGKDPNHATKKYIDWRRVFLNAIEGNWLKLWYAKDGVFALTTVGAQADLSTLEAA